MLRRQAILILIITLASLRLFGQDVEGQWHGLIESQGISLRIVFNITKTNEGYAATMDSPDQGAKGIVATSTRFEPPILEVRIENLRILYKGELLGDSISGQFSQGGLLLPMTLLRKPIEKKEAKRPQEPEKPYSYYSEELTITNSKDAIQLAGTLTLPSKEGKYPLVILISGSGPQNRDGELYGHKPFLVLADYLTKNGVGVLRFDDRGVGKSTGNFHTATTLDFANDVETIFNYLKMRTDISAKGIGLIGHSEGALVAQIVASRNKDIKHIVLLAGPAVRGDQILLRQQELIAAAEGVSEIDMQKAKSINKGAFDIVARFHNEDTLKDKLHDYFNKVKDPSISQLNWDTQIQSQIELLSTPWMHFFLTFEPSKVLSLVKCPVLAINGEKDTQVESSANLAAISKILSEKGNQEYIIKELPNANHLFQECKTGSPAEYGSIEQTLSPVMLVTVSDWIHEVSDKTPK